MIIWPSGLQLFVSTTEYNTGLNVGVWAVAINLYQGIYIFLLAGYRLASDEHLTSPDATAMRINASMVLTV